MVSDDIIDAADQPAPGDERPAARGGSVFDRIRARRTDESEEPRSEATLEDVASAIADASIEQRARDDATTHAPFAPDAVIAPLQSVQSKEWRRQVRHSIDQTRDELKDAHASVRRLKKSLLAMQQRRQLTQSDVISSILRAETLLNDIRKDRS